MIEREENEARVSSDLVLIYPLVTYQKQYWLEDNFEAEEKLLKEEIE